MRQGFAIAFLALLPAAGAASAETPEITLSTAQSESCSIRQEDETNCVHFVGCFGTDGDWFAGTSRGWNAGLIEMQTRDGVTCSGDWTFRPRFDMGKAVIACDDGEEIPMSFFVRAEDGTAVSGTGISNTGRKVQMYAGPGVAAYLRTRADTLGQPLLFCGPQILRVGD